MTDVTLLIVDDDSIYRESLVGYTRKLGYTTLEASSGNAAFNIIQSQPIAAVITDLRMKDGTGIELLRKIRKSSGELPRIPKVIVNTGLLEGGEDYLRALGASFVFIKPVDSKTLAEHLKALIE
jgi:CheY-like chemotaxis protein